MTFPATSAEHDWPNYDFARWAHGCPWAVRVLDLRPTLRAPEHLFSEPDILAISPCRRYVTDAGLVVEMRQMETDVYATSTFVLTLATGSDPTATVAVLIEGEHSLDAQFTLTQYGLPIGGPRDDHTHLHAVHTALSDPNSWFTGLADADLSDPAPGAALAALLHLAHPRFANYATARPLTILWQEVAAEVLMAWANSGYTNNQIMDLAVIFGPDEVEQWLDDMPSAQAAGFLTWCEDIPDRNATGVAALAAAGWQPPTVNAAWPLLTLDSLGTGPTNDTLCRLAQVPLQPLETLACLRAGLSLAEIETLARNAPETIDWPTMRVMAALREPS